MSLKEGKLGVRNIWNGDGELARQVAMSSCCSASW